MVQKTDNRITNYHFSSKESTEALVEYLTDGTGIIIPTGAHVALGVAPDGEGLILSVVTSPDGSPPKGLSDKPPRGFH